MTSPEEQKALVDVPREQMRDMLKNESEAFLLTLEQRKWMANSLLEAQERVGALEEALSTINNIRNDIIQRSAINWSAHIYPLVAVLNNVGFKGDDYTGKPSIEFLDEVIKIATEGKALLEQGDEK